MVTSRFRSFASVIRYLVTTRQWRESLSFQPRVFMFWIKKSAGEPWRLQPLSIWSSVWMVQRYWYTSMMRLICDLGLPIETTSTWVSWPWMLVSQQSIQRLIWSYLECLIKTSKNTVLRVQITHLITSQQPNSDCLTKRSQRRRRSRRTSSLQIKTFICKEGLLLRSTKPRSWITTRVKSFQMRCICRRCRPRLCLGILWIMWRLWLSQEVLERRIDLLIRRSMMRWWRPSRCKGGKLLSSKMLSRSRTWSFWWLLEEVLLVKFS